MNIPAFPTTALAQRKVQCRRGPWEFGFLLTRGDIIFFGERSRGQIEVGWAARTVGGRQRSDAQGNLNNLRFLHACAVTCFWKPSFLRTGCRVLEN